MSEFESSATQFRPQIFNQLVGQEFVVRTLQAEIEDDSIAHAYLFSGPRGVGKTSAARLLAQAINYPHILHSTDIKEEDVDTQWHAIRKGNAVDVIEIDGASHTSVQDVRKIREEVLFAPQQSKYKIYIVDEVHMLSGSAFNALLKTIEEPPSYVIFIFATTEIHKVPTTVRSRCQQFNFRHVPLSVIVDKLHFAANARGLSASEEVLFWIAKESSGSLRDAYTLFDQIAVLKGALEDVEKVFQIMGKSSMQSVLTLAYALSAQEVQQALGHLHDILASGVALERFIMELCDCYRIVLLRSYEIDDKNILKVNDNAPYDKLASQYRAQDIIAILDELLQVQQNIRTSPHSEYELELVLAKIAYIRDALTLEELVVQVRDIAAHTADEADTRATSAAGAGTPTDTHTTSTATTGGVHTTARTTDDTTPARTRAANERATDNADARTTNNADTHTTSAAAAGAPASSAAAAGTPTTNAAAAGTHTTSADTHTPNTNGHAADNAGTHTLNTAAVGTPTDAGTHTTGADTHTNSARTPNTNGHAATRTANAAAAGTPTTNAAAAGTPTDAGTHTTGADTQTNSARTPYTNGHAADNAGTHTLNTAAVGTPTDAGTHAAGADTHATSAAAAGTHTTNTSGHTAGTLTDADTHTSSTAAVGAPTTNAAAGTHTPTDTSTHTTSADTHATSAAAADTHITNTSGHTAGTLTDADTHTSSTAAVGAPTTNAAAGIHTPTDAGTHTTGADTHTNSARTPNTNGHAATRTTDGTTPARTRAANEHTPNTNGHAATRTVNDAAAAGAPASSAAAAGAPASSAAAAGTPTDTDTHTPTNGHTADTAAIVHTTITTICTHLPEECNEIIEILTRAYWVMKDNDITIYCDNAFEQTMLEGMRVHIEECIYQYFEQEISVHMQVRAQDTLPEDTKEDILKIKKYFKGELIKE